MVSYDQMAAAPFGAVNIFSKILFAIHSPQTDSHMNFVIITPSNPIKSLLFLQVLSKS